MMMRLSVISIFAGVWIAACAQPIAQDATPGANAPASATVVDDGQPLVMGHTYTIKSDVLGMDRRLTVRIPYGYDMEQTKDKYYPVVYVIDGGPEQDFPHIAGLAQSREVNGTFSSFILVGIETVNRRHQIVPPATEVDLYEAKLGAKPGGSAKFREFIRGEVMPWVNERHRTNGRDVIMGESLAGLFVVESLFEDPTLFDDYIAITPSLWWEEMKYGNEAADYLDTLPSGQRRLYVTSSDEGYRHQEGVDKLIAALKTNAPENLQWIYFKRGERETHASIYHMAALDAFRVMFPVPTRNYGRPGYLLSGEHPQERTPEQEAMLETECEVDTSVQVKPSDYFGLDYSENAYRCIVIHYGETPTAGNMKRFTEAGKP